MYSVSRVSHLIRRLAMRKLSLSLVLIQRSTMRLGVKNRGNKVKIYEDGVRCREIRNQNIKRESNI